MDAATLHLERPLALEQAHMIVDGLRDHGRSPAPRRRDDLACEGGDDEQRRYGQPGRKEDAGPSRSRSCPPGHRPDRGQLSLEGNGRRVLWGTPLEDAGQLPVGELRARAVGALVEMPAQGGHEIGGEAAVLIFEQLVARIGAVHG